MVQQSKNEYLAAIWGRYRRVGKKAKGRILDEFTTICGYNRKYAIARLKKPRRRRKNKPVPRQRDWRDACRESASKQAG